MKPKISTSFSVVALQHDSQFTSSITTIKKIIMDAGKGKTLFIEGSEMHWPERLKIFGEKEPFSAAVLTAKRLGWKIGYLDRAPITDLYFESRPSRMPTPVQNYIIYNLREKDWVRRINQIKSPHGGLILIHPNHIEGFLKESGLPPIHVIWVDRLKTMHSRRLTSIEVRDLKLKRAVLRTGARPRRKKL